MKLHKTEIKYYQIERWNTSRNCVIRAPPLPINPPACDVCNNNRISQRLLVVWVVDADDPFRDDDRWSLPITGIDEFLFVALFAGNLER